jgi:predicted RNase H-like nuclease (RuvC/YqgF family)
METKIEERIKLLEDLYVSLLDTIKSIDRHTGISIGKLEERIKSLEGGCKCKNNNSQELDKLRKENKELNEELARLRTFAKQLLSCI